MNTIKRIVDKYNNLATDSLKERFVKDNIQIKTYIPYLNKVKLATNLANVTMLDRETGNINVKSDVEYLLFWKIVIEQYTDIVVETTELYEEYDMLNQSGLLEQIVNMIPEKEIGELRMICEFKKNDVLTNQGSTQAFVSRQIENASNILGVFLKPMLEKISNQLDEMDDDAIKNSANKFDQLS